MVRINLLPREITEKRKAVDMAQVAAFLEVKKAAGLATSRQAVRQNVGLVVGG